MSAGCRPPPRSHPTPQRASFLLGLLWLVGCASFISSAPVTTFLGPSLTALYDVDTTNVQGAVHYVAEALDVRVQRLNPPVSDVFLIIPRLRDHSQYMTCPSAGLFDYMSGSALENTKRGFSALLLVVEAGPNRTFVTIRGQGFTSWGDSTEQETRRCVSLGVFEAEVMRRLDKVVGPAPDGGATPAPTSRTANPSTPSAIYRTALPAVQAAADTVLSGLRVDTLIVYSRPGLIVGHLSDPTDMSAEGYVACPGHLGIGSSDSVAVALVPIVSLDELGGEGTLVAFRLGVLSAGRCKSAGQLEHRFFQALDLKIPPAPSPSGTPDTTSRE